MGQEKAKTDYRNWAPVDVLERMDVEVGKEHGIAVLQYIEDNLAHVIDGAEADAEFNGSTIEDWIIGTFNNDYNDGVILGTAQDTGDDRDDQEIIEVSQVEVKHALKTLLTKQNDIMSLLYMHHEEYNQQFFYGRLSVPVITIDKLSNKTLGNYTAGTDNMELENHIRFNRNFIALNTETRILETLRHEMIHHYQDECLYERKDKDGVVIRTGEKRPKEWHNSDFKEWAAKVGIPCIGRKGGGNPALMPEAKSYNRKFTCGCIATNGYPMTIWSTRAVKAQCLTCGEEYTEVKKAGKVIAVTLSDIENNDSDAIEKRMLETFRNFERFEIKVELTNKVKEIKELKVEYKEGIYQKGHNAYAAGYRYWVAWSPPEKPPTQKPLKKAGIKRGAQSK